jgi:hypothetical protein
MVYEYLRYELCHYMIIRYDVCVLSGRICVRCVRCVLPGHWLDVDFQDKVYICTPVSEYMQSNIFCFSV